LIGSRRAGWCHAADRPDGDQAQNTGASRNELEKPAPLPSNPAIAAEPAPASPERREIACAHGHACGIIFKVMTASDNQLVRALVHDASVYLQSHGQTMTPARRTSATCRQGSRSLTGFSQGTRPTRRRSRSADFVAPQVRALYLA